MQSKIEKLLKPFLHLMPIKGNADTLHGEIVRALNKIAYRYYNDGDLTYDAKDEGNYVVEAMVFLCDSPQIPSHVSKKAFSLFREAKDRRYNDKLYEKFLLKLCTLFVDYMKHSENEAAEDEMFDYDYDDYEDVLYEPDDYDDYDYDEDYYD